MYIHSVVAIVITFVYILSSRSSRHLVMHFDTTRCSCSAKDDCNNVAGSFAARDRDSRVRTIISLYRVGTGTIVDMLASTVQQAVQHLYYAAPASAASRCLHTHKRSISLCCAADGEQQPPHPHQTAAIANRWNCPSLVEVCIPAEWGRSCTS